MTRREPIPDDGDDWESDADHELTQSSPGSRPRPMRPPPPDAGPEHRTTHYILCRYGSDGR